MRVGFFGQFLLERGEIDEQHLRAALDQMELQNLTLSELAVRSGFASEADCRRVSGEQRRRDLPFGELAVKMGVLSSVELDELLHLQREQRLDLGTALVRSGVLREDQVSLLLDEFKSEQACFERAEAELPSDLQGLRVAEATLQSLERFCDRIARTRVRVGSAAPLDSIPEGDLVASIAVQGTEAVRITLAVQQTFGERLATGILGMELAELASELALDAVGEFLNVVLGNVVASLEGEHALELRVETPKLGESSEWKSRGVHFPIATEAVGEAHLIIEPLETA